MNELSPEILEQLGAAFPDDEVEFLPRGNYEGKARALAYIDARSVMRRLDAVVGPANWSFDFDLLSPEGKMVKGKLTVFGVTKCDAGEGSSEDEVLKSAVSDALKRCAVHFGIGRYLYYLPSVWAPYDQRKRQFAETPRISPAAVEKALAICGITTTQSTAPQPASAPASRGRSAAEVRESLPPKTQEKVTTAGELACSRPDCGKPLTKGQHDVSVRAFGQPLCPACQKQQARAAA